jgi:hypothetical protein
MTANPDAGGVPAAKACSRLRRFGGACPGVLKSQLNEWRRDVTNRETPIDELKRLIATNAENCLWLQQSGMSCSNSDLIRAHIDGNRVAKRMVALVAELDQIAADAAARLDLALVS